LLSIPNSESNSTYLATCKRLSIGSHPARFPPKLPEFFVRMLTRRNDLVLDFFAGSNTTGMVAEREGRRWLSFELDPEYVAASAFRFMTPEVSTPEAREMFERIKAGDSLDLSVTGTHPDLFARTAAT